MERLSVLWLVLLVAPIGLAAQQPTAPHDSLRGAIRVVDVPTRTLEVVTGVGYALRVVRLEVPPDVPITASGIATLTLRDLRPGDIVAASFGGATSFVAYSIRRVGRVETGPGETP